jgi:tyrosyl-tRNA synthetase
MSLSDELMWRYYELLTDRPLNEIAARKQACADGENPMDHKIELAKQIITDYHGAAAAGEAEEAFRSTFSRRQTPEDIPEARLATGADVWIVELLLDNGLVSSKGDGRRMVRQGAVSINGEKISDEDLRLALSPGEEKVIKVGKRRWLKVSAG